MSAFNVHGYRAIRSFNIHRYHATIFSMMIVGCGDATIEAQRISFRRHALSCVDAAQCSIPDLKAKVNISDHGDCELMVTEDQTVEGVCEAVPKGAVRQFQLSYYVTKEAGTGPTDVTLASSLAQVDLTSVEQSRILVEFPAMGLNSRFDTDRDGVTNLCEVCLGTDPLTP